MRNWLKTVLFMSAFSPVLLTLAYVRFDLHGPSNEVWQLVVIGVLGTLIPLLIIGAVASNAESMVIDAKKVEANDFMMFVFIAGYFVPLLARASEMDFSGICLLAAGVGVILWFVSVVPTHPVLQFVRFRFYKIEASSGMVYVLITRREIMDPRTVRLVKKLSSSMLLEAKEC
jgi:hypothetical protein